MSTPPATITGHILPLAEVVRIADGAPVRLAPEGLARLQDGERWLAEALARGESIYGTTSMVGAFKDSSVPDEERARYALRLLRSHLLGTGHYLPVRQVRAAMAIRLNGILTGRTGASAQLAHAMAALLNAGITPAVPEYGSIGCADVGLMSHIGATLIGEALAFGPGDAQQPIASAHLLAHCGLAPIVPGPKDVMAVLSSNALAVAGVALEVAFLRAQLPLLLNVFMIGAAGFGAFGIPWETALRTGTAAEKHVAAYLRHLAAPDSWMPRRNLQDPLSFRCLPQIAGGLLCALERTEATLSEDIARADDNPVLIDGRAMTSGASLPLALALDAQALGIALCHYVRGMLGRILALCRDDLSGLPRNLTLAPGRQVAFGAVTKLAADLTTSILRESTPASLYQIPVANGYEDEASYLPSVARALALQMRLLMPLAAVEAMAGRQAVALSGADPQGPMATLLAALAASVPMLDDEGPVSQAVGLAEAVLKASVAHLAPFPPLSPASGSKPHA